MSEPREGKCGQPKADSYGQEEGKGVGQPTKCGCPH